ncbi:MAG: hypothetical protein K9G81_16740 [Rhodobacteraceae bacterium]|nr:hypothetical protein [Paracoccaceae bacterium]
MTGGIGKKALEAGVWMSMSKELTLLLLIKWNQPRKDWLDTDEVVQQASVRVAPFPRSARQDSAICSRMAQLLQRAMKACGINASNLVECVDHNAGRVRSFKDAGFDRGGAKACCKTRQKCGFSRPRFG